MFFAHCVTGVSFIQLSVASGDGTRGAYVIGGQMAREGLML